MREIHLTMSQLCLRTPFKRGTVMSEDQATILLLRKRCETCETRETRTSCNTHTWATEGAQKGARCDAGLCQAHSEAQRQDSSARCESEESKRFMSPFCCLELSTAARCLVACLCVVCEVYLAFHVQTLQHAFKLLFFFAHT